MPPQSIVSSATLRDFAPSKIPDPTQTRASPTNVMDYGYDDADLDLRKRSISLLRPLRAIGPSLVEDEFKSEATKTVQPRVSLTGLFWTSVASCTGHHILKLLFRDLFQRSGGIVQATGNNTRPAELTSVSLIHAAITTGYSLYSVWNNGTMSEKNRHGSNRVICYSLGYFLHDFIATRNEWQQDPAMLVHHLIGIGAESIALRTPETHTLAAPLLVIETSTVFLNLMHLLAQLKLENTKLHKVCQFLFAVTFGLGRCIYLPLVLAKLWPSEAVKQFGAFKYSLLVLCGLNFHWMRLIVKKSQHINI
jgi:hypothetical protein